MMSIDALTVCCTFCGADVGEFCMATNPVTKNRYITRPHSARVRNYWSMELRTP